MHFISCITRAAIHTSRLDLSLWTHLSIIIFRICVLVLFIFGVDGGCAVLNTICRSQQKKKTTPHATCACKLRHSDGIARKFTRPTSSSIATQHRRLVVGSHSHRRRHAGDDDDERCDVFGCCFFSSAAAAAVGFYYLYALANAFRKLTLELGAETRREEKRRGSRRRRR